MNRIIYLLLFFLIIMKIIFAAETESVENESESSDVIDLSESDLNSTVLGYESILVEFYAPWCGVCQSVAQHYQSAAAQLKANNPPIPLAKFNCDTPTNKNICRSYEIPSFPTFKVFKEGEYIIDYKGNRGSEDFVKFMKYITQPASQKYSSIRDLEQNLTNAKDVIVLGIFKTESHEQSIQTLFHKAADKMRERAFFGHVFTDSVPGVYKLKLLKDLKEKPSNIILMRGSHLRNKFEPHYEVYNSGEVTDFVNKNFHGLVGHRTIENRLDFKRPSIIAFYNVDYKNHSKTTNYWRNRILKVAQNYKDITFAISDSKVFDGELKDFGFQLSKERDSAPLIGARDINNAKFVMKNNFTVENFEKFVKNFVNGELEPFVISQELPTDNENANVKVAVANNFKELVIQSEKDILLEFYAPWCGHCKQLEPIYEKLGKRLKNEPGVNVVKIDASNNDIPAQFEFKGYPTIYWYPKNKNLQVYEGERELKDLLQFVAKHSTEQLIGYDRNGKKKKVAKTEL